MYNLLICEDEAPILLGLEKLIRSFELPIGKIYLAEDGLKALELLRSSVVHIVFTDIEMPVLNGLDLLKHVTGAGEMIQRVIITGHRNFDYAQTAIHLGIHDYVLKPIDERELYEVLTRRIQALKGAFTQAKAVSELLLIQLEKTLGRAVSPKMRAALKNAGNISFTRPGFVYAACYSGQIPARHVIAHISSTLEQNDIHFIFLPPDARTFIGFINTALSEEAWEQLVGIMRICAQDMGAVCALSGIETDLTQLSQSIVSVEEDLCTRYFDGRARLITPGLIAHAGHVPHELHGCVTALGEHLKFRFAAELPEDIEHLFSLLEADSTALFSSIAALDAHTAVSNEDIPPLLPLLRTCGTLSELKTAAKRILLECYTQQAAAKHGGADGVSFALEYVEQNYAQNLRMTEVADMACMNYSYFSTLFKRRTGMGFSAYLQMVRVARAKELLAHSNLRINEIARQVGFDDEKYFSKVFKQFEKLTPSQYRSKIGL